jgi:hypothetical protein
MIPSNLAVSYTDITGNPIPSMTSTPSTLNEDVKKKKPPGREVSYGRYIFRNGKIFDKNNKREVSQLSADLTSGEIGAYFDSQVDLPEEETNGAGASGGRASGGGFTDGTSGSRLGGTSVDIRGGGGGDSLRKGQIPGLARELPGGNLAWMISDADLKSVQNSLNYQRELAGKKAALFGK